MPEIKKLLEAEKFIPLKNYVDSASKDYSKPENNSRILWDQNRELIPGYSTSWFFVREQGERTRSGGYTIDQFFVYILSKDSIIIHYEIRKRTPQKVNDEVNEYYPIVDSSSDNTAVEALRTAYKKIYNVSLQQDEMFGSYVYGHNFGYGGGEPGKRMELDLLIAKKDIALLNKWLTSPCAELQVYAIDGFFKLKKKGYKLSTEQARIIEVVKNKEGTIETCSGCIYRNSTIKEVLTGFRF